MEFTEEEVKKKLKELGYINIPPHKLQEFMTDLQELVENDSSSDQLINSGNYSELTHSDSSSITSLSYQQPIDETYFDRVGRNAPLSQVNHLRRPTSAFSKEKMTSNIDHHGQRHHNHSNRHHASEDKENFVILHSDADDASVLTSDVSSHTDVTNKTRRKVARKCGDRVRVFDETMTDNNTSNLSDVTDITLLEERIKNLPFSSDQQRHQRRQHDEHRSPLSQISSVSSSSLPNAATSLPAFIRTSKTHPHTKGLRKCDPVSRYHQFKHEWDHTKLPGESKHSSLRWQVRGQMLNYEAFEKPKHKPMVNNYVVPTEKKRQALRWQVRTALANT